MATVIALLIAIFFQLHEWPSQADLSPIAAAMVIVGIPFFFVIPLGVMWAWTPLQHAELQATPCVIDLFKKNKSIRFAGLWLTGFILVSFGLASDIAYLHTFSEKITLAIWIILLGLSLDLLHLFLLKTSTFLDPFRVVKMFKHEAILSIQADHALHLCHWIDMLSETANKGIQRHSTSITHQALGDMQELSQLFLSSSKSIAHREEDKQTKALGITDTVSYAMFYLYQRLDVAFDKALNNHFEATCSLIITLFGKISIDAAKYDMSMATIPLKFLSKCAKRAQDDGMEEAAMTASCIFSEIAKVMIQDIDISYTEIKDPFLSLINGMETLAKGMFKRDKSMKIIVLMIPFQELRKLFENEKVKDHADTPVILQNIDRVLGEFEALHMVMTTMPKLPEAQPDKEPPLKK